MAALAFELLIMNDNFNHNVLLHVKYDEYQTIITDLTEPYKYKLENRKMANV